MIKIIKKVILSNGISIFVRKKNYVARFIITFKISE